MPEQVQFTIIDDLPPGAERGYRSKFAAALEAAKQHPGRWLHLGRHNPGSISPARKRGYEVAYRHQQRGEPGKGMTADIYIRWPATDRTTKPTAPTPEPVAPTPATARPSGPGKVVACGSCDFRAPADKVAALVRHCVTEHDRPATRAERTPVPA